jgi:Flp pilus assembly protein TadG
MRRLKSLVRDEDASGIVEFSLAATMFLTLIFAIVEFSMVMYTSSFVAYAAQEGTRYAMVRGKDWNSSCASATSYSCKASAADVQNYILNTLPHPGINLVAADITPTWLTTTATGAACVAYSQGCQVRVQVSYTFNMNLPFYSPSFPFSTTSIETIQD